LEGCHNSPISEEFGPAQDLFRQFLEQICSATLVEFGYLPFKDFSQNIDLITNLLKEAEVRERLTKELQLDGKDLFRLQRIKFLVQRKDTMSTKSFEEMVDDGEKLLALCEYLSGEDGTRVEPQPEAATAPERLPPSYVTTGYEDLDDLLLGGIPENYAVIMTSPSCDERDLMIERFLEAGARNGQTTFYVTINPGGMETLAEDFPANFQLFICNPEADAIIKDLPNVHKLRGVQNLTDIDIALNVALSEKKKELSPETQKRICFEIVSDVLLQHQAVVTRRWLTALIPKFKSKGFTMLAVMNPHMHSPQEVQATLDLFQGEIHVYRKKTQKGLRQFLRIEKMYNREYKDVELPLRREKLQKKTRATPNSLEEV
jgi:KaiC/GvpD/RAD55 family RecA-like ATPase